MSESLPTAEFDAPESVAQFIDRAVASESIGWESRGVQYVYRLWVSESERRPLARDERQYLVALLLGGRENAEAVRVPAVGCHGRRGYVTRNLARTRDYPPGSGDPS